MIIKNLKFLNLYFYLTIIPLICFFLLLANLILFIMLMFFNVDQWMGNIAPCMTIVVVLYLAFQYSSRKEGFMIKDINFLNLYFYLTGGSFFLFFLITH